MKNNGGIVSNVLFFTHEFKFDWSLLAVKILVNLSTARGNAFYNWERTSSAIAMVFSISSSVCAMDMKPASYMEGAK